MTQTWMKLKIVIPKEHKLIQDQPWYGGVIRVGLDENKNPTMQSNSWIPEFVTPSKIGRNITFCRWL